MLPNPQNYAIYPSVMLADQEREMIISPTERAFLLFEGEEYLVTVYPINTDAPDYHLGLTGEEYRVTAHNGVVRFSHTFAGEQQHLIVFAKDEKKLGEFMVYSLKEDLYALTPLRGDLHGHSYRSDGARDPAALAGHYREQGYDFFALTDHNRFYPGYEIDEVYANVHLGITRVPGEEVHTPGSPVHIVHVGGKKSVALQYIKDRKTYEDEVDACLKQIPAGLPECYHERYAMALWSTQKIHEADGIAIFAHPFWRPKDRVYNVCEEFATMLLTSGMFDAYELVGGMRQIGINRSVAMWNDLRANGLQIPVVGSSDVHTVAKSGNFPHLFTVCFAKSNTPDDIIDAVKNGLSVAVEATGTEYDRQYRAYGSLRLVSYAQYLLTYFFPAQERICQGEGIAMRAYAMNDADASLVEAQVAQTKCFRDRFFGKMPPRLPDAAMIDFENRVRARHLDEGPVTKGSAIDSETVTRQI
ncbi:MAG: hypothetical protein E7637_03560 [Ruminococcaceae bacterium]|nr:hypothetical protein [Oscillospiraceae bacterium]